MFYNFFSSDSNVYLRKWLGIGETSRVLKSIHIEILNKSSWNSISCRFSQYDLSQTLISRVGTNLYRPVTIFLKSSVNIDKSTERLGYCRWLSVAS